MTKADKEIVVSMIRKEIREATGIMYGHWVCDCGGCKGNAYYRDPRNYNIPMCPCGKLAVFQEIE